MTNNTVYFERQLDSVFTAYQNHFLLFFFLLQAALSVAVSRFASLSKSASSSLSLQAGFSGSHCGITIHSFGSSPGSGHAFTSGSASKSGSTSTCPSPGIGEKTLSLSTRFRLMSKLDNSTSANRRVSGVTGSFPSLLLARTKVLALALRSPAASLERSRRAVVAALSDLAAAARAAMILCCCCCGSCRCGQCDCCRGACCYR